MPRIGTVVVTWIIEAAFGYDPDDTAPVWTDITAYVRGFNTRRGRKQELDRVTAGTATIRLDNRDRRFEAGYTGGPYGSNVVPMTPIRIRVTRNAVTYPIFYGFADEWEPVFDANAPKEAFVDLYATDAFKALALINAPESVWASVVAADTPTAWWRLGESSGTTCHDASGNGHHGTYGGGATFFSRRGLVAGSDDNAIDFAGVAEAQVPELLLTSTSFTIEGWFNIVPGDAKTMVIQGNGIGGLGSASDWTMISIVDSNGAVGFYLADDGSNYTLRQTTTRGFNDDRTHHVMVTRNGSTIVIYIDGTARDQSDLTVGSIATTSVFRAPLFLGYAQFEASIDGVLDEWAIYNGVELTAADALAHFDAGDAPWDGDLSGTRAGRILDLATWPAGLRSIDTGVSTLGVARLASRTVIDLLHELNDTERGDLYVTAAGVVTFKQRTARHTDTTSTASQATYSYTGASNGGYQGVTFDSSDRLIVNHAKIKTPGGVVYESEDATSISRYLRRTKNVSISDSDPNVGQALAEWEVQIGKDPQRRITSLRIPTHRNATTFDDTLALELTHRITVDLDPPGTGTISQQVYVEGIDHDVTRESWTTTLWCSPTPSYSLAIVGVSLVGGSEVVGY